MTEVGGAAATHADPLSPESFAAAVTRALGTRPAVTEACMNNAARFSTSAMILSYVALYRGLTSHSQSDSGTPADALDSLAEYSSAERHSSASASQIAC